MDEKYPHNAEAQKRMDEAKPTPTQAEIDAAVTRVDRAPVVTPKEDKPADDDAEEKRELPPERPSRGYKTRGLASDRE